MNLRLSTSHQIAIGAAASMLILLLLSQIAYRTAGSLEESGDVASRAQNVLLYSDNLLLQLDAMDRELEARFAGPGLEEAPRYVRARTRIAENLELLEALSTPDQPDGVYVRNILRLTNSKLSAIDRYLTGAADMEAAGLLALSGSLTANLVSEITRMQRVMLANLAIQTVNESMRASKSRNSILLVTVGAIAFLLVGSALMIGDLRKRQTAADRLRESERRFRMVAASAPVGIFLTDRGGHITYANQRYTSITGLDSEDVEGAAWTTGVHPEDLDPLTREWREAVALGREFEAECRLIRTNGQATRVLGRSAPLVDESGSVTGFVGSMIETRTRPGVKGRQRPQALAAVDSRQRGGGAAADGGGKVLVVTGDRDLARTIAEWLGEHSVSTDLAARGADALDKLSSEGYEGIVLHLVLPDMDSRELLSAIRQSGGHRTTPVLAITPGDGRQAVAGLRVQGFVEEPVRMESLLDSLRRAGLPPRTMLKTEAAVPASEAP